MVPYRTTWALKQLPEVNQSCNDGTLPQLIQIQDLLQPGAEWLQSCPGGAGQWWLNVSQLCPVVCYFTSVQEKGQQNMLCLYQSVLDLDK